MGKSISHSTPSVPHDVGLTVAVVVTLLLTVVEVALLRQYLESGDVTIVQPLVYELDIVRHL